MGNFRKLAKRALLDMGGVMLILASILFGWIPGPGGIPLLLAGLGLLSINHPRIDKVRQKIQKSGMKILKKLFKKPALRHDMLDFFSMILIGGGIYLLIIPAHSLALTIAGFNIFVGVSIFLGNRKRLQKLTRRLKF